MTIGLLGGVWSPQPAKRGRSDRWQRLIRRSRVVWLWGGITPLVVRGETEGWDVETRHVAWCGRMV